MERQHVTLVLRKAAPFLRDVLALHFPMMRSRALVSVCAGGSQATGKGRRQMQAGERERWRERDRLAFSARAYAVVAVIALLIGVWSWSDVHDLGIFLVIEAVAAAFAYASFSDAREAHR